MPISDKTDIAGIHMMMNGDDVESQFDLEEMEKNIINGKFLVNQEDLKKNMADDYMNSMMNLDLDTTSGPSRNNFDDFDNRAESEAEQDNYPSSRQDNYPSSRQDNYPSSRHSIDNMDIHTKEHERSQHINEFLRDDSDDDDDTYDMNPERIEDNEAMIVEQIEHLKTELESEGCDVSKYEINKGDSYDHIKKIWEKLKLKSQYKTYSNMFDEGVLLIANGVEWAFDGKKDYYGYRPNMDGWSDTVNLKLKRMRLETATLISGVIQRYKMSSGISIFAQLAVSGILYSVTKSKSIETDKSETESYTTEAEWRNAAGSM